MTKSTKPKAEAFFEEFGGRIQHVDEIVIGAKSNMGNYFLATANGTSDETLRRVLQLIKDELKERKKS